MLSRNYPLLVILILCSFTFISCNGDNEPTEEVTLNGSSAFPWNTDGKFLKITTSGAWNINFTYPAGEPTGWCSTSTTSGTGEKNVWVATTINNIEVSRHATIIVNTETSETRIDIVQYGKPDLSKRLELPKIEDMEWFLEYEKGVFALEYDITKKHSKWVAWILHKGLMGSSGRTDAWQFDPRIPAQYSPTRDDFRGFDRGHLCPSADRTQSREMNEETFMYSNMSPQVGVGFNQGIWADLENKERAWVSNTGVGDTIYICAGGTILKESDISSYSSPNRMAIPKYNFKVILRKKAATGAYDAIGFWFENRSYGNAKVSAAHAKSVDEIEALTGIDFFYGLSKEIQDQVEANCVPANWGL